MWFDVGEYCEWHVESFPQFQNQSPKLNHPIPKFADWIKMPVQWQYANVLLRLIGFLSHQLRYHIDVLVA